MKRYLGKAAAAMTIHHGSGGTTAGTWLAREMPLDVGEIIAVQQKFALSYDRIETGDEVVDAAGLRWIVIEASMSSFAGQHSLTDMRLGALEP